MSSMLEQAIVDATALKEAAMKNAEATILEKYSKEIKETVNNMLNESPEKVADFAAMEPPEQPEQEMQGSDSGTLVLDLSKLEELARSSVDGEMDMEQTMAHEDLAGDVKAAETMLEPTAEVGNIDEEIDLANLFEGDEQIEISKEEIKDIVEKLTLDFQPEKTGWLEKPQYETRQAELEAEALAAHDDSDSGEIDKLKEALQASEKQNKNLRGKLKEMTDGIQEMKSFANKVKGTLSEVNLQNARLLYTNKALSSDSLNERQKEKLAEAVSNAETIEEARVIFETLQSTVGSTSRKKQPKSLSEAVQKPSSMIVTARTERRSRYKKDPTLERWKFLAGIDNQ